MKYLIKNSYFFLLLLILLLVKDSFYNLFVPKYNINISNIYTNKKIYDYDLSLINDISIRSNYYVGKILYQNPLNFGEEIYIAINNKIKKNDYVINNDGLIGIIDKVYSNYSKVKLITNKDILMQIRINDCYGLIKYENDLVLFNINNKCKIQSNDIVYTSNLGYLDEIIKIGYVYKTKYNINTCEYEYYVKPFTKKDNINYVVVINGEL